MAKRAASQEAVALLKKFCDEHPDRIVRVVQKLCATNETMCHEFLAGVLKTKSPEQDQNTAQLTLNRMMAWVEAQPVDEMNKVCKWHRSKSRPGVDLLMWVREQIGVRNAMVCSRIVDARRQQQLKTLMKGLKRVLFDSLDKGDLLFGELEQGACAWFLQEDNKRVAQWARKRARLIMDDDFYLVLRVTCPLSRDGVLATEIVCSASSPPHMQEGKCLPMAWGLAECPEKRVIWCRYNATDDPVLANQPVEVPNNWTLATLCVEPAWWWKKTQMRVFTTLRAFLCQDVVELCCAYVYCTVSSVSQTFPSLLSQDGRESQKQNQLETSILENENTKLGDDTKNTNNLIDRDLSGFDNMEEEDDALNANNIDDDLTDDGSAEDDGDNDDTQVNTPPPPVPLLPTSTALHLDATHPFFTTPARTYRSELERHILRVLPIRRVVRGFSSSIEECLRIWNKLDDTGTEEYMSKAIQELMS